jgi:hypothetical protein
MGPAAVAKLKGTVKVTNQPVYLMSDDNSMAGFPTAISTILDTNPGDSPDVNTVLFGVWSQLLVAYWSGIDILPNPYDSTGYLKGRVLLRVMRDVNGAVRHPESFAFGEDLPAT